MVADSDRNEGVLLIHVWREEHGIAGLRARISSVARLEEAEPYVRIVATTDDVLAAVRTWLAELS
jgi:hypothetical protein